MRDYDLDSALQTALREPTSTLRLENIEAAALAYRFKASQRFEPYNSTLSMLVASMGLGKAFGIYDKDSKFAAAQYLVGLFDHHKRTVLGQKNHALSHPVELVGDRLGALSSGSLGKLFAKYKLFTGSHFDTYQTAASARTQKATALTTLTQNDAATAIRDLESTVEPLRAAAHAETLNMQAVNEAFAVFKEKLQILNAIRATAEQHRRSITATTGFDAYYLAGNDTIKATADQQYQSIHDAHSRLEKLGSAHFDHASTRHSPIAHSIGSALGIGGNTSTSHTAETSAKATATLGRFFGGLFQGKKADASSQPPHATTKPGYR